MTTDVLIETEDLEADEASAPPQPRWSDEIGITASGWLMAAVAAAIAAAAPAYPGVGITASTDMPMLWLAVAVVALAGATLTSKRPTGLPAWSMWAAYGAFFLLFVLSGLISDFAELSFFGSPTLRMGLLTAIPVALMLVLARGFRPELRVLLAYAAPIVYGSWTMALAIQQATPGGMKPWGLSSNNALSAQIFLLLLPAAMALAGEHRAVRIAIGLAVALLMWWASSALGLVLALLWTLIDALIVWTRVERVPRIGLLGWPAVHLAASITFIGLALARVIPEAWLGGRTGIWRLGLDVFLSKPFLGVGPDALPHASTLFVSRESAQVIFDIPLLSVSAHSIWLDTAAATGVFSVAVLLVAFTLLASKWSPRTDGPSFPYVAGLLVFSITLIFQPLSLQTLPVLMLAIAASLPGASVQQGSERLTKPVLAVAALSGVLLFVFAFGCVSIGRPEFRPGPRSTAEAMAKLWRSEPELWAQTAYRYGMEVGSSADPAATAAAMEGAFMRAIELSPKEYRYRLDLAGASEALGAKPAFVKQRYDDALAAFPLSTDVNYRRGLFLASIGDVQGAQASYDVLRSYYPEWSGTAEFARQCKERGVTVQ